MKKLSLLLALSLISCNSAEKKAVRLPFTEVRVELLLKDSVSLRALEIMGQGVAFAGTNGYYGYYDAAQDRVRLNQQLQDSLTPEFRAVASTPDDFFMLSAGNPALLYKTGNSGQMELVYREDHERVFYDAMAFWNPEEGIAIGDPTEDCLSILITRDGGASWSKLNCNSLPKTLEGEVAFAASNSNLAVKGEKVWIITGGTASRVFFSGDKGKTWEVFDTPISSGEATTGAYSVDFYDAHYGVIIGGDYTAVEENRGNKALTRDGGRTWSLIADGKDPGYKSSIRFVPGSEARELVATGFTGISYSADGGDTWQQLSEEGFYTLRFLNDSTAYAGGKNKLARLNFR